MSKFMHIIFIALGLLLTVIVIWFVYGLLSTWLSGYGIDMPGNKPNITTVYDAVAHQNPAELVRLINEGADINAPDYRGDPPLNLAAATDQWQAAELLIDRGANIWATNTQGYHVGIYAFTSHVATSTVPEGVARERVISKLKAAGYPWPPPWPDNVRVMIKEGTWPPTEVTSQ